MTNNINIEDIAWSAGIIDGEGCIYIHKGLKRKGAINSSYSLRLRVSMTHFPTIYKLQEIWGGDVSLKKPSKNRGSHKNQACWEISSYKAGQVLESIIKFSVTKKEEIFVALEFIKLPKATSFTFTPTFLLEERERLFLKIKLLKKYRYEISDDKKQKEFKKDKVTQCSICNKEMPAFNKNGTPKNLCSGECRYKAKRVLSDEREKEMLDTYQTGMYSYNELARKFNIKRGTVGWILNKYK